MVHTIDLHFLKVSGAIAAYCIPTDTGAVLVECGPHTTTEALVAGLAKLDFKPTDIKAVLLTHIHFDHAGAAWWWAQQGAQIYVHPRGYKHLLAPERLYESARRIYGDAMDRLWGAMNPITEAQLQVSEDREEVEIDGLCFQAHHTPGHASHHIAWQLNDLVFTGDVGGVKIGAGPIVPPCPPPDIHLTDWTTSINRLRSLDARRFYLTHFGPVENLESHLDALETRLKAYANWVKPYAEQNADIADLQDAFLTFVEQEYLDRNLNPDEIQAYRAANPPDMSLTGLMRYWHKHGLTDET